MLKYKVAQIFQKLTQMYRQQFLLKSDFFKIAQKSNNKFCDFCRTICFCFLKRGPFPASFVYFRLFNIFNTDDSKQVNNCSIKNLLMTGFEPRTSGIRSDRCTNWDTTTTHCRTICFQEFKNCPICNMWVVMCNIKVSR